MNKRTLIKENPAAAAAAAMTTVMLLNKDTGRKNKAITALRNKDNPAHGKAVGIFQKLKDKFKKKEDEPVDKVAQYRALMQKTKDDAHYAKQYAARTGKELDEGVIDDLLKKLKDKLSRGDENAMKQISRKDPTFKRAYKQFVKARGDLENSLRANKGMYAAARTGKELDESIKMHTISGNQRFMTKTAIPILKKYGVKNIRANTVGGYFLELRFQIDSRKLKELDKELKRKNKTAYGGIVENRRDKMKITEDILRRVIRSEIKKTLIKESSPGFTKREFGDPLPTFKDVKETHQNKIVKEDEDSFSQPIPAQIDRYMKKFIDAVSKGNLNRKRKLAILGRTIVALKLDPQEVSKYARLVKREL